jgi:hypothetical protein
MTRTKKAFFQHAFPHERSDLSHWRKRLGDKLEKLLAESLRVAHARGALRTKDLKRVTVDTTVQPKAGLTSKRCSNIRLRVPSRSARSSSASAGGSWPRLWFDTICARSVRS